MPLALPSLSPWRTTTSSRTEDTPRAAHRLAQRRRRSTRSPPAPPRAARRAARRGRPVRADETPHRAGAAPRHRGTHRRRAPRRGSTRPPFFNSPCTSSISSGAGMRPLHRAAVRNATTRVPERVQPAAELQAATPPGPRPPVRPRRPRADGLPRSAAKTARRTSRRSAAAGAGRPAPASSARDGSCVPAPGRRRRAPSGAARPRATRRLPGAHELQIANMPDGSIAKMFAICAC